MGAARWSWSATTTSPLRSSLSSCSSPSRPARRIRVGTAALRAAAECAGQSPPPVRAEGVRSRRVLNLAERDRLRALPEGAPAELVELFLSLHERREMVRPEVARLRRERAVAVREEQLRLALATGVERELAGVRVRRRVLRADPEVAVAPRDPVRLTAPAAVDDPLLEREDGPERGHGLRRQLLLEARHEAEISRRDLEHGHGIFAPWRIQRPSRSRSAWVMPVTFPRGIAFVVTACCSIRLACALICEAVSSLIPRGAASTFVGWSEWQAVQRWSTIRLTWANATDVPAADSSRGRITIASAAIASAAVTGIAQTFRPACRRLKKWRTHAPITSRTTRISHA